MTAEHICNVYVQMVGEEDISLIGGLFVSDDASLASAHDGIYYATSFAWSIGMDLGDRNCCYFVRLLGNEDNDEGTEVS